MEEVTGTGGVRVAALNLWGRRGPWAERRSMLIDGFRELRPDLVAFQEAIIGEGYDQAVDLLGPASTSPTRETARSTEGMARRMDRGPRSRAAGR